MSKRMMFLKGQTCISCGEGKYVETISVLEHKPYIVCPNCGDYREKPMRQKTYYRLLRELNMKKMEKAECLLIP